MSDPGSTRPESLRFQHPSGSFPADPVPSDAAPSGAAAASSQASGTVSPRMAWLLLGSVILLWGINWPVMKLGLKDIPPMTFAVIRIRTPRKAAA